MRLPCPHSEHETRNFPVFSHRILYPVNWSKLSSYCIFGPIMPAFIFGNKIRAGGPCLRQKCTEGRLNRNLISPVSMADFKRAFTAILACAVFHFLGLSATFAWGMIDFEAHKPLSVMGTIIVISSTLALFIWGYSHCEFRWIPKRGDALLMYSFIGFVCQLISCILLRIRR